MCEGVLPLFTVLLFRDAKTFKNKEIRGRYIIRVEFSEGIKGKVAMRCECGFFSSFFMFLVSFSVLYCYDTSGSPGQDAEALADILETFSCLEV